MGTLGLNMSEAVVHRPVACNFVRKEILAKVHNFFSILQSFLQQLFCRTFLGDKLFTIISIVKKARSNYFRTICREAYSEPC